jgi:uncharacterized protein YigE (DUF2233 family)
MKIIVLTTQVLETDALKIDIETGTVERDGIGIKRKNYIGRVFSQDTVNFMKCL